MANPKGFKLYQRELPAIKAPEERVKEFKEFYQPFSAEKTRQQAARCMDCGVPFCHHGCPLGNNIPEFNEAVYEEDWARAIEVLSETNNFPEFTGRICPAPCEGSCVLGINQSPVAIEFLEKTIAEKAFSLGLVKPNPPAHRSGLQVAVIGSGPAGLAAAAEINAAGHWVTVFEREERPGGLLRYGIPDFKLEKWVVERRTALMEQEGVAFRTGVSVGSDISVAELKKEFEAVVLCIGSTVPRDLPIPGRELDGVHFAMDFLTQQNKVVAGEGLNGDTQISARGKNVIVIGGGDTGADCVGTSNRQGAASVVQIELLGKPPVSRGPENPWPEWPMVLRTSSSHEEGCERNWSLMTEAFLEDEKGRLKALQVCEVRWENGKLQKIAGTEKEIPCELALLAIGFVHPDSKGIVAQFGLELDSRGNIQTQKYHSSVEGVFAAGDARRGQSLVVWAIAEGRKAARELDLYLKKISHR